MARPTEPCENALYEFQKVTFSHFDSGPGESLLLTADPWSYLDACLSQHLDGARGQNRKSYLRARYYAELAQGFYAAAESVALPTKGTLIYYGMLNLAKCYLATLRIPLEEQLEHHGLTLPFDKEKEVTVTEKTNNSINIFHEFADALGTPVVSKKTYDLKQICSHIPEIHEITFALGHLPNKKKRLLLPVQIAFMVNKTKDRLFTEIKYEKKNEARVQIDKFYKGTRMKYFKDLGEENGWHIYRSHRKRAVSKEQWPRAFKTFCSEFSGFDLASILTHEGYRYYVDLGKRDYHHLAWTLMLMYYIGSIARYRPVAAEAIMNDSMRPLISEAVAVCPKQFLYQLTSFITKRTCSVPHASLG